MGYGILALGLIIWPLVLFYKEQLLNKHQADLESNTRAFKAEWEMVNGRLDKLEEKFKSNIFAQHSDLREHKTSVDNMLGNYSIYVTGLAEDIKAYKSKIENAHEHVARFGESLQVMRNEISNKRPILKMSPGPIQLEIYSPAKNLGKKNDSAKSKRN